MRGAVRTKIGNTDVGNDNTTGTAIRYCMGLVHGELSPLRVGVASVLLVKGVLLMLEKCHIVASQNSGFVVRDKWLLFIL